jgi:hypothetical protein
LGIEHIHTYLVRAGKGSEVAAVSGGTSVPLSGKIFRMLESIYVRSDQDCDIEISFNQRDDGAQQNPCRDLVVEYVGGPTLTRGRKIAERLQQVTDQRSGLGLLFLICGKEGRAHKVVVSRFPTDTAILAEEGAGNLTVAFLDRVFMKSASSFKAVAYQDASLVSGFWFGRAIDRQINSRTVQVSNYWISEFLLSGFRLTPAAGTRRLAAALRNAARESTDVKVKSEIAAAVTLASRLAGRTTSISGFLEQSGLSDAGRAAVMKQVKSASIAVERFKFDLAEFKNQVGYRSIQLDNGAMLSAEAGEFDSVFQREALSKADQEYRFSTQGKVVGEKLRKTQ